MKYVIRHNRVWAIILGVLGVLLVAGELGVNGWEFADPVSLAMGALIGAMGFSNAILPAVVIAEGSVALKGPFGITLKRLPFSMTTLRFQRGRVFHRLQRNGKTVARFVRWRINGGDVERFEAQATADVFS